MGEGVVVRTVAVHGAEPLSLSQPAVATVLSTVSFFKKYCLTHIPKVLHCSNTKSSRVRCIESVRRCWLVCVPAAAARPTPASKKPS
jgi:hypothetical protein